jgi:alpha-D-xyloside xylohydrolase
MPVSVWPRFDAGTANAQELEKAGGLFIPTYKNVYPPGEGRWYDAWNPGPDAWFDFSAGTRLSGGVTIDADAPLDRMPVFVRAGSIVPLGPVKPYADAPSEEPLEVRVYPGKEGYDRAGALTIGAREGHYPAVPASLRLRITCGSGSADPQEIDYTGSGVKVPLSGCR